MAGVLFIIIGLAAVVVSWYPMAQPLPWTSRVLLLAFGLFSAILGLILTVVTKLYVKTSAEEALVRTGWGGSRVIIDGGCIVVPIFHRVRQVSLKVIKLCCVREGSDALITRDYLRADVHSEFYMRVGATQEDVLNAARSFGEDSGNEGAVDNKVGEKLVSALRSVAATHDLAELHSNRETFASQVQEVVAKEIAPNGLILETVTISRLDQTDPSHLNENNVFDAQGKKKITEITASMRVQRNQLERDAEQATTAKDVETRKAVLKMEQDRALAEAEQAAMVAKARAEREKEAQVFQVQQKQQEQQAAITAELAVKQADIAKQQSVQVADVEREREVQMKLVEQQRAIEVATREQQIAIAMKEAERAAAEQARLQAEAAREAANQQVKTVEVEATARREAQQKLIEAENQAQMALVAQERAADAEAYARIKQAEAEQEAAIKQAAARMRLAEAEAQAKSQEAEGETALQMVPVTVAAKQVEVQEKQVEVDRLAAEYKQTFERAAIDFELRKLEVLKRAEVQVALAGAIGQFMQQGKFTVFGDPETMSRMMDQFVKGVGTSSLLEGFSSSLVGSNGSGNGASGPLSEVATLVGQLVKKVTGDGDGKLDEEAVRRVVEAVTTELSKQAAVPPASPETPSAGTQPQADSKPRG